MWCVERNVGKLVEIRIWTPVSLEETGPWSLAHDRVVASVDGPYVCFVDLVGAAVFPPEVVSGYVQTMRNEERLLRTGTLLASSPTFGLQIHRMIREANNPQRRAFHQAPLLFEWLSKPLDAKERVRLRALLRSRS